MFNQNSISNKFDLNLSTTLSSYFDFFITDETIINCSFQLTQSRSCYCYGGCIWIHPIHYKLNISSKNKHFSELSLGLYASPHHSTGDSVSYFSYPFLKSPTTSTEFETNLLGSISVCEKNSSHHKKLNIFCFWKRNFIPTLSTFSTIKLLNEIFYYHVSLKLFVPHIKLYFHIKIIWIIVI